MAERGSCGSSKLKHTLVSTALVVYVIHRSLERDGYGRTRTSGENGRKKSSWYSVFLTHWEADAEIQSNGCSVLQFSFQ